MTILVFNMKFMIDLNSSAKINCLCVHCKINKIVWNVSLHFLLKILSVK